MSSHRHTELERSRLWARPRRIPASWLVRIAAALALAGCGAGASAQPARHVPVSFPNLGYRYIPPHIPRGVRSNAVLVVDLTNVARVAPPSMRLASDSTFSGARWKDWGATRTTANGTATIRVCNPNCGAGQDVRYPATVVLSHVAACQSHRFYEDASVTLDTVKGRKSWGAVLRRPCSSTP